MTSHPLNVVTADTPLQQILELMQHDGYVLMEDALSQKQLKELNKAYDQQLEIHPSDPKRVEIKRIMEQDPVFEQLMDLPTVFPVARALIGSDIELATSGELDHKMPNTPAHIGWHNDFVWMINVPYPRQNFWIRATYFLSDVTEEMGPFTLIPGTHLAKHACPSDYNDEQGKPKTIDGQVKIIGKAGSCLINNTEIWHTNTPNYSNDSRRLIMILYKHAWMKQWQNGYESSPEFCARQSDPLRQQLLGSITWHSHRPEAYPAFRYFDK
jgi:ectoine hydroxylase